MNTLTINGIRYTEEEFYAWLHKRYEKFVGDTCSTDLLPVAAWLRACGHHISEVTFDEIVLFDMESPTLMQSVPTPAWLKRIIRKFYAAEIDHERETPLNIRGKDALHILESSTCMYAVVELEHTIFGTGYSPEAAWKEAEEWLDPKPTETDKARTLQTASLGDIVCAPCSDALMAHIETHPGVVVFTHDGNQLTLIDYGPS